MSHTLLLADDSVTIQRVIELTFADEDIRVIAVGDGQEALARITADRPDIVLADTGMPEVDGYDVAAFIKEDPALSHIPVVLLTGAFEPVDGDRARQVGCEAVLVKPFEPQVVIDRVRELLGLRPSPEGQAVSPETEVAPAQDVGTDASTADAETAGHPAPELAEPVDVAARHASAVETEVVQPVATNEQPIVSDDPLEDYLERMDEAFDRLEAGESAASVPVSPTSEEPLAAVQAPSAPETDVDPLETALSDLEGALDKFGLDDLGAKAGALPDEGDVAPSTVEQSPFAPPRAAEAEVDVAQPAAEPLPTQPPQVMPTHEPVAPVSSVPSVSPSPESVWSAPPAAESRIPVAPVPEVVAPVVEPSAPPLQPSIEVGVSPLGATASVDPSRAAPPPSLADAFASLLAAEQGDGERPETVYPWPRPVSLASVSEELIERVTERVIARLSEGVGSELVGQVVARVAEKLVRQEIDRIKHAG